MLRADQATKVSGEGYLLSTIMHEIAHGLGPAFARTPAGKMSIRESIGPDFSGLEEAKADVVGMFGLKWLVDHGRCPRKSLRNSMRRTWAECSAPCDLAWAKLTAKPR